MYKRLMVSAILSVLMLSAGCGDDDPAGPKLTRTGELAGTWLGTFTVDIDGDVETEPGGLVIDSQGNVTEFLEDETILSTSGRLSAAESGEITGTMTLIAQDEDGPVITASFDCEGQIVSNTQISLSASGTWTDDTGGNGMISFSGTLAKNSS